MKENKYAVRIFDGVNTIIYTIKAYTKENAEAKVTAYYTALHGEFKKVTVTQIGA